MLQDTTVAKTVTRDGTAVAAAWTLSGGVGIAVLWTAWPAILYLGLHDDGSCWT
jgi:hypothetical protein